ncbi:hypothetical protein N7508_007362 [Penicillium antarcticum]|uniref:uncharacterized protein n=1 Tax=Penicillium antarcticum TaxID=416450 RepID=UPI00238E9B8D|nr:uncharacterized protein N7508_007362 [Penicillium antarcticum]KAJ5300119.1 hypothetical protein N7508_007362 [Penicillium antarcticum]
MSYVKYRRLRPRANSRMHKLQMFVAHDVEQLIANRSRSRGELPIPADSDETKGAGDHRVFPLLTAFTHDLSASASRRVWEAVSIYDCISSGRT